MIMTNKKIQLIIIFVIFLITTNTSTADTPKNKANIKSVISELIQLFSNASPPPVVIDNNEKIAPSYTKVIKTSDGRSILIYRPRFTSVKQMFKAVDGIITENAMAEYLEEQNEIVINVPTSNINNYIKLMEAMDTPPPQILIEAKVVEVTFGDGMQRNLSILYSNDKIKYGGIQSQSPITETSSSLGIGGEFRPTILNGKLDVKFQWLLTAQDAKIISSPNILISRNEISKIITGQDIPIQEASSTGNTLKVTSKYKNVGVTLEVEPIIVNNGNVTLRVYPKVSNIDKYEQINSSATIRYPVPVISIRSVETFLRMHNQQVVVLGGLYNSNNTIKQERIPILSDIPLLGELFTAKHKINEVTHLIFFLKVHIIPAKNKTDGIFYNTDQNAKLSETLGNVIKNSQSIPIRKTSIKKTKDEFQNSTNHKRKEVRQKFHDNFDKTLKK